MVLTDLQRRKLTRFFRVYDIDGDGVIQRKDYIQLAHNVARAKNLPIDSPLGKRMEEVFLQVWENLEILADKNYDHVVTLQEFLDYREKLHTDEGKYRDLVEAGLALFDLLDMDQNGIIDVDEFVVFYEFFDLPADLARDMFERLDASGKGYITREESIQLGQEFNLANNPDAPGNWLFGPF